MRFQAAKNLCAAFLVVGTVAHAGGVSVKAVLIENGSGSLFTGYYGPDVGSAIKGAQRADIFFGSGKEAGNIAGRTKSTGRMYTLLPIETVRRLIPEG
jgi:hypothetical protein